MSVCHLFLKLKVYRDKKKKKGCESLLYTVTITDDVQNDKNYQVDNLFNVFFQK